MVIALLCLVLSFVPEDLASSMIEHGLAQTDEQQTDSQGAGAGRLVLFSADVVCGGGTEAIFQLRRHRSTFWRERLSRKAGQRTLRVNRNWGVRAQLKAAVIQYETQQNPKGVSASIGLCVDAHTIAIFMTSSRRDRLYWRAPAVKRCQLSCHWWALCGLARRGASVDGCRWPYNERQERMDTVVGLNGASPLFMRQDFVVS